jgi:hypothetical protein
LITSEFGKPEGRTADPSNLSKNGLSIPGHDL